MQNVGYLMTRLTLLFFYRRFRDEPTVITTLSGKQVIHIGCGSTYSAALTAGGELFTWGRGNYGRLGHGGSEDQCTPVLVSALKGHKVIDMACGSGDAQTLAVTDTGRNRRGVGEWAWELFVSSHSILGF